MAIEVEEVMEDMDTGMEDMDTEMEEDYLVGLEEVGLEEVGLEEMDIRWGDNKVKSKS